MFFSPKIYRLHVFSMMFIFPLFCLYYQQTISPSSSSFCSNFSFAVFLFCGNLFSLIHEIARSGLPKIDIKSESCVSLIWIERYIIKIILSPHLLFLAIQLPKSYRWDVEEAYVKISVYKSKRNLNKGNVRKSGLADDNHIQKESIYC